VGTYYGAPQFAVSDALVPISGGSAISPLRVSTAKLAASLEWRLISLSGTVTAVTRDGDSWHAELAVTGGAIPVDGLSRSGIPSTALVVGRTATITGIVKRPYPTASDQRMAIVPRTTQDISLGGATPKPSVTPRAASQGSALPAAPWLPQPGSTSSAVGDLTASSSAGAQPQPIALADIASHEGATVLVGGRIEAIDGDRLLLNDGTSTAAVRLASRIGAPSFSVGALVNARGVVTRTEQGGLEVVVDDATQIRALDPSLARAEASAGSGGTPAPQTATEPSTPPAGNPMGLAVLGVLAFAGMVGSAGVAVARRPGLVRAVRMTLANMRTRE
jgi:hypothetical protein